MRGSCLCGGIAWEIEGPLVWNSHCHCSMCRKAHGAAFATFVGGDARGFRWLRGEDLVTRYQSSPGGPRAFCSICGAVVPVLSFDGAMAFLPLGNSDDEPSLQPQGHIYVASKAPWFELPDDGLPRFDAMPEGMETPDVAPPPRRAAGDAGRACCAAVASAARWRTKRVRRAAWSTATARGAARDAAPPSRRTCSLKRDRSATRAAAISSAPTRCRRRRASPSRSARCAAAACRAIPPGRPTWWCRPARSTTIRGRCRRSTSSSDRRRPGSRSPTTSSSATDYPPGCASSHEWVARQRRPRS